VKIKTLLPDGIQCTITCKGKMATLLYEESFRIPKASQPKTIARTMETIRRAIDPRLRITHRVERGIVTFQISGRVERTVVGNMLAGEFFALGNVTLRDVLVLSVVARSQALAGRGYSSSSLAGRVGGSAIVGHRKGT
jgi:hypothetical protein